MDAAHFRQAFLQACWLDVAVRKPGNVSLASPGHGMQAQQFLDSAAASVEPLLAPGARVGERIDAAMAASWAAAQCNTNLGIVLLAAPVACALERIPAAADGTALAQAVEAVLADLDVADAQAAYRAIARTRPGGLGDAPEQDVRHAPTIGLRQAMALAAGRDRIALLYAQGYDDLFERAQALADRGYSLMPHREPGAPPNVMLHVQQTYLGLLAQWPDSHIVRKHGEALAQSVLEAAQGWRARGAGRTAPYDDDPAYAAWDEALKSRRLNPGTTADLTVAVLLLAALVSVRVSPWHGT